MIRPRHQGSREAVARQAASLTRTGTARRLAGDDRYATMAAVAAQFPAGRTYRHTDVLTARSVLDLRPAPEVEAWLAMMDLLDDAGRVRELTPEAPAARALLAAARP